MSINCDLFAGSVGASRAVDATRTLRKIGIDCVQVSSLIKHNTLLHVHWVVITTTTGGLIVFYKGTKDWCVMSCLNSAALLSTFSHILLDDLPDIRLPPSVQADATFVSRLYRSHGSRCVVRVSLRSLCQWRTFQPDLELFDVLLYAYKNLTALIRKFSHCWLRRNQIYYFLAQLSTQSFHWSRATVNLSQRRSRSWTLPKGNALWMHGFGSVHFVAT